jgi:hypothetical protein
MDEVIRRCIWCRGERQVGEIKERIFIEPISAENTEAATLQGYICEECAVVHWAWEVNANT